MNAIVFDSRVPWFSVSESNRSYGLRPQNDLADRITDQLADAAPRPRGGLAQRVKLFLAEVNLGLFHVREITSA